MNLVNYSDAEVLRCLSFGIVSKGLYMQNDLVRSISPRYHLVKLPDDVEFFLPSIPETVETFELLNQDVSEQFKSVLNNGGRSLATRFLNAIANFFSKKKKDIDKLNDSIDPFFKKWSRRELLTSTSVPMASVQIENTNQCTLSVAAMQRLLILERNFQSTNLNNDFLSQCEDFFMDFGSHYFIGTYHLGGFRKDTRIEEAKEIKEGGQKKQHDSYTSLHVNYEKSGGSAVDDEICAWKRSFVGKPLHWFVIDKEQSCAMNYRAVWNLIDSFNFNNQYEFSDALKQAWKTITGLSINPEIDGIDFILENQIRVIEEKLEKDIFLLNCTENLSIQTGIETTVQEMIMRVKNNYPFSTWTPGGLGTENREQRIQRTKKELEMVILRLFDKYLTEIEKTGDVQDSVGKVLESENLRALYLTSGQEVSESQTFLSAQVHLPQFN